MLPLRDHRRALVEARVASMKMLDLHREVLERERRTARLALQALQRERERTAHALHEYEDIFGQSQKAAHEYRIIWARAKKEGARLLEFIDRRLKRAA